MAVETNFDNDRLIYRGGLNTLMVNLSINGIRSTEDFTAARKHRSKSVLCSVQQTGKSPRSSIRVPAFYSMLGSV